MIGVSAFAGTLAVAVDVGIAGAPQTHDVRITAFRFEPRHLVVKPGDMIRWTNADLAPHTATATDFGWDTGELGKGDNQTVPVTKDMETSYFCAFHPHMKGTLEVRG